MAREEPHPLPWMTSLATSDDLASYKVFHQENRQRLANHMLATTLRWVDEQLDGQPDGTKLDLQITNADTQSLTIQWDARFIFADGTGKKVNGNAQVALRKRLTTFDNLEDGGISIDARRDFKRRSWADIVERFPEGLTRGDLDEALLGSLPPKRRADIEQDRLSAKAPAHLKALRSTP